MKISKRILSLFAVVLISATTLSCIPRYYKTIQQPDRESVAIKAATEFKVRPIDFSSIKPEDLGYAKAEEWKADLEPVPLAFADAFPALCRDARQETQPKTGMLRDVYPLLNKEKEVDICNRKISMVKKDEPVTTGIVVDIVVKEIILKWKFYVNQQPDEFICQVTFTDAGTGQRLFSGVVNVNSKPAIPPVRVGGLPYSHVGGVNVGPGMFFGSRIQAASYNLAGVLARIMTFGKIDPADY